jgi:hypothetical protein
VVRAEDSHPSGRGFESRRITHNNTYVSVASYYISMKRKIIKVAKWGTPKNKTKQKKKKKNS